jgi:hypothetical protein
MALTTLHVTISALVAYPVLSLTEYVIHRHFMHRRTLARVLRTKYLADTFRNHAIVHHAKCYAVFDSEKDKCGEIDIRVQPITLLTVIALPCTVTLAIDPITSMIFAVGGIVNGSLWSEIHSEMHRPRGAWFSNTRWYLYLKRRHYLHHRHPNSNFNTLFPMWDWVLRTTSVETDDDRMAMKSATWRVRPLSHDGIYSA